MKIVTACRPGNIETPRARRQNIHPVKPSTSFGRASRRRENLSTLVIPTEPVNTAHDLLQAAENCLLDPRADMYNRGELAARIAVYLADRQTVTRL